MKLQYSDAKRFALANRASKSIHGFDELQPDDKIYLVPCVSWPDRTNNLSDQEKNILRYTDKCSAVVVGVNNYIGSRYDPY
jgi:hypothetical protein